MSSIVIVVSSALSACGRCSVMVVTQFRVCTSSVVGVVGSVTGQAFHQIRNLWRTETQARAAGAGAAIAVSADVTVVADDAMLSFLFISRGLVPDYASTWLLPRLVGLRTARRLCLLGERLTAQEALELGLVDRVVAGADLLDEATRVAQQFAAGAGVALRLTKRLLAESFDVDHATAVDREFTAQSLCFGSADAAEGMAAFLSKREPEFQWR